MKKMLSLLAVLLSLALLPAGGQNVKIVSQTCPDCGVTVYGRLLEPSDHKPGCKWYVEPETESSHNHESESSWGSSAYSDSHSFGLIEGKPLTNDEYYELLLRTHCDYCGGEGTNHAADCIIGKTYKLWQDAIRQGIEDWNIAFQTIGHPNLLKAITFSESDSDFDPFDITSNTFFRVESQQANAEGRHWIDPRSGEILQADVLFYSNVITKLKSWLFLQTAAYNPVVRNEISDTLVFHLIRYAAAHEIGHCLGLEHNFRASHAYRTEDLRDPSFCEAFGTTASIMDYARFNYVAQPGDGVTYVFPPILGPYDIYAIQAGYSDFPDDAAYRAFIDQHQADPCCLYRKASRSVLPNDPEVQASDLGDDALASTRYGIANLQYIVAHIP